MSSDIPSIDIPSDGEQLSPSALPAALSRSIFSLLVLTFSRPIRLFRPSKITAFTGLNASAAASGATLDSTFVWKAIRQDGLGRFFSRHMLAPLVLNSAVGFTLFSTYGASEHYLSQRLDPPYVPAACGMLAGAAQSCISSPLDNIRFVVDDLSHSKKHWPGWSKILQQAARPSFLLPVNHPSESTFSFARHVKRFATRGWSMFSLTLCRDSLGFAVFFSVFEAGRQVARDVRQFLSQNNVLTDREWFARTVQAVVIICGGSLAGLMYGLIGRPFDAARSIIWERRIQWAKEWKSHHKSSTPIARHTALSRSPGSLPSAFECLADAYRKRGLKSFVSKLNVSPNSPAQPRLTAHPALGGTINDSGNDLLKTARRTSRASKFFTIVPVYSVGFLFYAIWSGDLQ